MIHAERLTWGIFYIFRAFAEYNRDQYIPTKVQGSEEDCLITDANDLGDSRFYDPRTQQNFKYVVCR